MKELAQTLVSHLVQNDTIWPLLQKYLVNVANYALRMRAEHTLLKTYPAETIPAGPFAKMILPGGGYKVGSKLIPKFTGTYEAELYPSVEELIALRPPLFIDVGCAEGYYAVGMAMRCPQAQVIAYDIEAAARAACKATAAANGVLERVSIREKCDPKTLLAMNLPERSVIMSDCEGYEKDLFTPDVVRHLKDCYLLIEIHDLYDPSISGTLRERFKDTHHLKIIRSYHDKSDHAGHLVDKGFSRQMIDLLTHEREWNMDWFYLVPLSHGKQG